MFRLAGLSLGLAQEEYEEANDEQGRQNNRCDFSGFLVVDCRGDHFDRNSDWNRLKPTINQKVSAESNRPFLSVAIWAWCGSGEKQETGWRSWVPWPHDTRKTSFLAIPPDISEVTMVHSPRVEATLAPLALLTKTVWLPWIKLEKPDAHLIRLSGKRTITGRLISPTMITKTRNAKPSAWWFRLDNILFNQGRIAIDNEK
ncbi:AsmA family protein [Escherichia coli]